MGGQYLAALNAGHARRNAPVDQNKFITDSYFYGPIDGENYATTGHVRISESEDGFILALRATTPDEGWAWVMGEGGHPRLIRPNSQLVQELRQIRTLDECVQNNWVVYKDYGGTVGKMRYPLYCEYPAMFYGDERVR